MNKAGGQRYSARFSDNNHWQGIPIRPQTPESCLHLGPVRLPLDAIVSKMKDIFLFVGRGTGGVP